MGSTKDQVQDMVSEIIYLKGIIQNQRDKNEMLEKIIDEQRLKIKLLQIELRRNKWWRIW